jgi:large subunit ribosomal protein L6
MSRIGKQPIELPSGVNVAISPGRVQVNGPLGELSQNVPARMQIDQDDGTLVVKRPTERGDDRALHGLTRSLVANMVEGVTKGFEKRLELQGVGYRAALRGTDLELNVGFSHPVVIRPPQGISFEVPDATTVHLNAPRRDRGAGAQGAAARALQGQGHPLRGRVRAKEGWEASVIDLQRNSALAGGTSRFPQTPSTGPLTRTGGCTAGKRA